ncbi:hypothetical protein KCP69_26770 (plasmid) [Salmonella enterica subsp. enterica]|nr:hypothetical protein KCP69_26770 [Salmonella enterica subsp. enterica]
MHHEAAHYSDSGQRQLSGCSGIRREYSHRRSTTMITTPAVCAPDAGRKKTGRYGRGAL